MSTWNKELQSLTLDEIEQVSHRFLMGWHDPKYDGHNFRIKGLNHRREEYGLKPLTKDWSFEYRIQYINSHYSYGEIQNTIVDYLGNHRVADERWNGIELFDCRFGREYAKLFKRLLGASEWRKISEQTRVDKLVKTQTSAYGVGVAGTATYDKMISTKLHVLDKAFSDFRNGKALDDKFFASVAEKIVFYLLVDRFGKSDVYYQYGQHPYDARYPYSCDFYIKSMDLFIELNIYYSHGSHWFDENSHDDQLRVKSLLSSNSIKVNKSVHTWCKIDVEKRQKARDSEIKYLVFWDGKHVRDSKRTDGHKYRLRLADFMKWFVDYDCDYESFVRDYPCNTY